MLLLDMQQEVTRNEKVLYLFMGLGVGVGALILRMIASRVPQADLFWPENYIHKHFMIYALLSIASASYIYFDFWRSYECLVINRAALIGLVLLQLVVALAMVVAIGAENVNRNLLDVNINFNLHVIATGFYLFLFVVWDILILWSTTRESRNKRERRNNIKYAKKLKTEINGWLTPEIAIFVAFCFCTYTYHVEQSLVTVIAVQALTASILVFAKVTEFEFADWIQKRAFWREVVVWIKGFFQRRLER